MSLSTTPQRAQNAIAKAVVLIAALALFAAACSSDDTEQVSAGTEAPEIIVEAPEPIATDEPETTTAPTAAPEPTTAPNTTDGTTPEPELELNFDAVDQFAETVLDQYGLEGAGLIVVDADGALHHQHYGTFTADRVSAIASTSKMVTAGVLLRLQEEGLLDIDAPLADVTDSAANHPDLTVAQLLSNSSGLASDPFYEPYLCQFTGTDLTECAETILAAPIDQEFVAAPDTEFRYGGAQWPVAGGIAEIASGESWAELVERIFIEPCGLEKFGYGGVEMLESFPEHPVWLDGADSVPETANPNVEGGGYGTTADLGVLLQVHLNGGQCPGGPVLSQDSIDAIHADRIGDAYGAVTPETGEGYGMGWWHVGDELIRDPGTFGSSAWINTEADYAAYWVIEDSYLTTLELEPELRGLVHEAVTGEPLVQG